MACDIPTGVAVDGPAMIDEDEDAGWTHAVDTDDGTTLTVVGWELTSVVVAATATGVIITAEEPSRVAAVVDSKLG